MRTTYTGMTSTKLSKSGISAIRNNLKQRESCVVKTYDMENVSRGYDAKYEMVESVDHKGFADGLGSWVRLEDYEKIETALRNLLAEMEASGHVGLHLDDPSVIHASALLNPPQADGGAES